MFGKIDVFFVHLVLSLIEEFVIENVVKINFILIEFVFVGTTLTKEKELTALKKISVVLIKATLMENVPAMLVTLYGRKCVDNALLTPILMAIEILVFVLLIMPLMLFKTLVKEDVINLKIGLMVDANVNLDIFHGNKIVDNALLVAHQIVIEQLVFALIEIEFISKTPILVVHAQVILSLIMIVVIVFVLQELFFKKVYV